MEQVATTSGRVNARPQGTVLLLILVAAVSSHAWMTGLEFQLDDWVQIRDAADPTRTPALLGGDPDATQFVSFFRPLLHLSFKLDVALFGTSSRALHAVSIFYHVLCCLVFYLVLCRFQSLRGVRPGFVATAAPLIMAVHPGCWGAVSWVAARGDVLACILSLSAFHSLMRWRVDGRNINLLLLTVATVMAILAKEGAIVVPILLIVADLFVLSRLAPGRSRGARLTIGLVLLAIPVIYSLVRGMIFGEAASLYGGAVRVINLAVIKQSLADFFVALPQAVGGNFSTAPHGTGAPWYWVQTGLLALLGTVLLMWTRIAAGRGRALLVLCFCFALTMGPAMSVYPAAALLDPTRLFYFGFPFVSVLLAMALSGWRSGGARALATRILFLGCIAAWIVAGQGLFVEQSAAARIIRRVRAQVEQYRDSALEPSQIFVIAGLPHKIDKIPLYGVYMPDAFHAVFTNKPANVFQAWREDLDTDLRSESLFRHKESVQVLRWEAGGKPGTGSLKAETGVLPGPVGYRPVVPWPAGREEISLKRPLRPRDIGSFALRFKETPDESFAIELRLHDDTGSFVATLDWKPQVYGASREAWFVLTENKNWLFRGEIKRLELVATYGALPAVEAIDFSAVPPEITLETGGDTVVSLADDEITIRFKEQVPCPWYRLRVFFQPEERRWTLPLNKLERDGETIVMRMSQAGFHPDEPQIPWEEFRIGARQALDKSATRELKFLYKVEGLRGEVSADAPAQSQSPISSFIIRR